MLLDRYLTARRLHANESRRGFARRAGVAYQTLNDLLSGKGCTVSSAYLIVMASREQPAPRGGTIGFEDLVPAKTRREAGRLRRASVRTADEDRPRRRRPRAEAEAAGAATA